jgi:hypothetical protein
MGVGKYEAGAHFVNDHVVNVMRPNHDKDDPSSSTTT